MFRTWLRHRLRRRPLPPGWLPLLERIPLYLRLPTADQAELHGHIQVFLAEKRFEGLGGLMVTEAMRVTVAAQACLLLLHRRTGYFPGLSSILIRPGEFWAERSEVDSAGVVTEGEEFLAGESWQTGTLLLSWEDVELALTAEDGYNVVLHEFAHQLDAEDGVADGTPPMPNRRRLERWVATMTAEYRRLQSAAGRGAPTLLDPYGAEHPAEFFAVATECFFARPRELADRHPALYAELADYYRQDPAASWRFD